MCKIFTQILRVQCLKTFSLTQSTSKLYGCKLFPCLQSSSCRICLFLYLHWSHSGRRLNSLHCGGAQNTINVVTHSKCRKIFLKHKNVFQVTFIQCTHSITIQCTHTHARFLTVQHKSLYKATFEQRGKDCMKPFFLPIY